MGALDGMTYRHSWGSRGFFLLGAGDRTLPRRGRVARYQKDPIPYGNAATLQFAGYDEEDLQLTIVIRAGDLAGWRNAIGSRATLAIQGDTPAQAFLANVGSIRAYPDDAGALSAQVQFVF